MRLTVTFTTVDYPAERHFHLEQSKAEAFAAKIQAEGGTATIGPLTLGADLSAMLQNAGVDPRAIPASSLTGRATKKLSQWRAARRLG